MTNITLRFLSKYCTAYIFIYRALEATNAQHNEAYMVHKQPAITFTSSPKNSHPIMVTPQRQNNDENVLFQVKYNTPKSRSSTQASTPSPDLLNIKVVNRRPDNKHSKSIITNNIPNRNCFLYPT